MRHPMVKLSPALPARVALVVGGKFLAAEAVTLNGQEGSIRVDSPPAGPEPVRLFLDWERGGTTELDASVRSAGGRLAHLTIHGISGDWRSFLDWLGSSRLG
jgi:hypothetical protein